MGELSRLFGAGAQIEHNGKVWKLSPWTYGVQAEYEQYLEEQAWLTCQRAARTLPAKQAEDLRGQTARDITAGVYSAGSKAFLDSVFVPKHLKVFLYRLIEPNQPEITLPLCEEMVQAGADKVIEKVIEAGSDPTRTPPQKPAGADAN